MLFSPNFPVAFRLRRESCAEKRFSVRCPWTVLLNGMAPKLVATTLPVLVVRKTAVKSAKPPGVKSMLPMRNDSGDSLGASCGAASPIAARALATLLELCRLASATWGVLCCPNCWRRASICCCCSCICWRCWSSCFCWAASASSSALSCSAVTVAGEFWSAGWGSLAAVPACASNVPDSSRTENHVSRDFIASPRSPSGRARDTSQRQSFDGPSRLGEIREGPKVLVGRVSCGKQGKKSTVSFPRDRFPGMGPRGRQNESAGWLAGAFLLLRVGKAARR